VGFANSFNDFLFSVVPFFMFTIFVIVTMTFITSFTEGLGQYLRNKSTPKKTIPARLAAKRTHNWGGYGDTDSVSAIMLPLKLKMESGWSFL